MSKIPFRSKTPVRNPNQGKKARYTAYFDQLKEDFNSRCGYCDSFDLRRTNDFEIDHFVPQRVFSKLKHNDYHNLVYSCKSCNRSKRGTWPSDDETVAILGNSGFVDPCLPEYNSHFSRYENGEIDWESDLGIWMYRELSLFNPKHSILWQLEKLMGAIEEAKTIVEKNSDNLKLNKGLSALFLIQENYLDKLFDVKR